jgi:hypothetical protein
MVINVKAAVAVLVELVLTEMLAVMAVYLQAIQ